MKGYTGKQIHQEMKAVSVCVYGDGGDTATVVRGERERAERRHAVNKIKIEQLAKLTYLPILTAPSQGKPSQVEPSQPQYHPGQPSPKLVSTFPNLYK